jgi:hypothetical protein|tara:strand:+ start:1085 stop:1420 length:336 start_codon:yes stop_codon:yes gene_type:complete
MARYANGKYAFGFCDRTGFRYKIKDLVPQIKAGRMTGLMVGKDMLDEDQPQNFLGRLGDYADPEALRNARSDTAQDTSRELFAFNPVGNGGGGGGGNLIAHGQVGIVKVTT